MLFDRHNFDPSGTSMAPGHVDFMERIARAHREGAYTGPGGYVRLTVDPVNGHMWDGRIIRTQEDFSRWGHHFKYWEEALRALPPFARSFVDVVLLPGTHRPMPKAFKLFGTPLTGFVPALSLPDSGGLPENDYGYPVGSSGAGVRILGSGVEELLASSAGVFNSTGLTDSGKSWTANQWRGATVEILTGTGAGSLFKITGNTATHLDFGTFFTSGSCTYRVVQPAAILTDYFPDGTRAYTGLALTAASNGLGFRNLRFGTLARPFSSVATSAPSNMFQFCDFVLDGGVYGGYGMQVGGSDSPCSARLVNCGINFRSGITYGTMVYGIGGQPCLNISQSIVYGNPGSYFFRFKMGGQMNTNGYVVVAPDAGWNSTMFSCDGQPVLKLDPSFVLAGNGNGTALALGYGGFGLLQDGLTINNFNLAVDVACGGDALLNQVSGTGNVNGWRVSKQSRLLTPNPAALVVTSGYATNIDGVNHAYSELAAAGAKVTGTANSEIMRIA